MDLRRLLEKIEIKYLHTGTLRLSAAQKYIEVTHELFQKSESFDPADLDTVFNLIVKPIHPVLPTWMDKKDPDTLDVFFLKLIEIFALAITRLQADSMIKAQLMCIDVHKLRILALNSEPGAVNFALNFIESCVQESPFDGRLWFQLAIVKFTFDCSVVKDFRTLETISRSILALNNPVDPANIQLIFEHKVKIDFGNTLLNLALSDFKDFVEKDVQTWSFVKYFQSFLANASEINFKFNELAAFFLFVLAFFKVSKNSFHFKIFLETCLTAHNQTIADFWPFFLFCILKLVQAGELELSDAIWFKIFQLLKSELIVICDNDMMMNSSTRNCINFLTGTHLTEYTEYNNNIANVNFDEEFSIERDSIIKTIVEEYFHFNTGHFKQFITMRSDRTLRLGSHFCEQETESEDEHTYAAVLQNDKGGDNSNLDFLDNSIQELRNKLETLSNQDSPSKKRSIEIDYLSSLFVLDTNVILTGNQQIKTELSARPELFIIPLVVLYEISRLRDTNDHAKAAWDFLLPLLSSLNVYNNFGRLLRSDELAQQLEILALTRTNTVNDDQIIDLVLQVHEQMAVPVILITEDLNMRLKAKSKKVHAISLNRFRKLITGGT